MKKGNLFFWLIIIILSIFAVLRISEDIEVKNTDYMSPKILQAPFTRVTIGNVVIEAKRVSDPAERNQGLGGIEMMKMNQGMLFEFETLSVYSFWMKDMNFPIDIIWINSDKKVVDITENITPDSYPQLFGPKENVLYVLEINAGVSKLMGLKIGDTVSF